MFFCVYPIIVVPLCVFFGETDKGMKKIVPYVAIITAMLIWAISGIAIKMALVSFTGLTLLVMRFTLAVILMLLVGMICRKNLMLGLQRIAWKDVPLFLLGGFFQPCLYYLLETHTYSNLSSPTIAEALLSTSPLLSPFFAWLLLRERVKKEHIIGIVVSTIGMLLLVMVGASNFELGNPIGILTAFGAVSAAVLYTVVLRRIPQKYNSLSIVFYIQLCALLMFYPMWAFTEGVHWVLPTDMSAYTPELWKSLGGVVYLAVFASVMAFVLFCYSVRILGVTRANAFNNVRPIFTALIMLLFLGEQLPLGKWAGIILIIVGLFICQRDGGKTTKKA